MYRVTKKREHCRLCIINCINKTNDILKVLNGKKNPQPRIPSHI